MGSQIQIYNISEIAQNEWKSYGLYTLSNRAIPHLIDGFKPSQRFYLYSSLINSKNEFKKVAAIAGIVSDYGYNHAEKSVEDSGKLMASDWANNYPLILGKGNFGSRAVQESAEPRYVYTKMHKNFEKFYKDNELLQENEDPEIVLPNFYVPILPMVLLNDSKGIAVGFASTILPRDINSVIDACKEYLNTGDIKEKLTVKYPHFTGKVIYDDVEDRYLCQGEYHKPSDTVLVITEIPYGFDRESYVNKLNKLIEDDLINDYKDETFKNTFKFTVKLKSKTSAKWDHDKIMHKFKLQRIYKDNLNVIDQNGNLREFDDEREIIKEFMDFKIKFLENIRIKCNIERYQNQDRWLNVKKEFLNGVLDNKIIFKDNNKSQVIDQIYNNTSALEVDINKLLDINMLNLTKEKLKDLDNQIKENLETIKYWKGTNAKEQFLLDIDTL